MAISFTLSDVGKFPAGTSVKAYPTSNWTNSRVDQSAAPPGSATDTQTMGASNLTFTGLTEGQSYVAYALVNSVPTYESFIPPSATSTTVTNLILDTDGTMAANSDTRTPTQKAVKTYSDTKSGKELGYAEITSADTNATTSYVDVAGLTTTVTVGSRPIEIRFFTRSLANSSTGGCLVAIFEGATQLQDGAWNHGTANKSSPIYVAVRVTPSAGSHTYKIAQRATTTGTSTLSAVAGGPAYIQVVEV